MANLNDENPDSGATGDQRPENHAETHAAPTDAPARAPADIAVALEAILITLDRAVPLSRLAEALGDAAGVEAAIALLNEQYEATGRAFRVERVAGGLRLMTLPQHADAIAKFHQTRVSTRLSRAAVETLAIIAYRQPITRAELESIRGVACGEVLKTLLERRLVAIVGRAEDLGRPMLYGTTKQFLEAFGLASLKDLPSVEEFSLEAALGEDGGDGAREDAPSRPDHEVEAKPSRSAPSEGADAIDTDESPKTGEPAGATGEQEASGLRRAGSSEDSAS